MMTRLAKVSGVSFTTLRPVRPPQSRGSSRSSARSTNLNCQDYSNREDSQSLVRQCSHQRQKWTSHLCYTQCTQLRVCNLRH